MGFFPSDIMAEAQPGLGLFFFSRFFFFFSFPLPLSRVTCPWCSSCDSSQSPRGTRPLGLWKRCRRDRGRINAWLIWPDWFLREIRGKLPFLSLQFCLQEVPLPAFSFAGSRPALGADNARSRCAAARGPSPGVRGGGYGGLCSRSGSRWESEEHTRTVAKTQSVT